MMPRARRIILLIAVLVLFSPAISTVRAEEPVEAAGDLQDEPPREIEPLRELRWSSTVFGQLKGIDPSQDDNGTVGFFDRYEFTANKDVSTPVEIGIREASFDWIEDGEALIQFRYESPTSNLGISGSEIDDAFFNQRALLLGRSGAFQLDIHYRRMRTEQLRIFPETVAGGGALPFTDLTSSNDRFYRERTGFMSELRWQTDDSLGDENEAISWLKPEITFRGGYENRDTKRQILTILNPGNDWLALSQNRGDEVGDVGVGVVVAPGGLFTMTADFDYQEFDSDDAQLDDGLPFASTSRSVGFVPSSERITGQLSLHSRIGERAVFTAGFQATVLEQESPDTPAQSAVDFGRNKTIVYSTQASGDVQLSERFSANAHFKYVYRDHDIDQSTSLFNSTNGSQVDEFLETYQRIDLGAETQFQLDRSTKLSLGARLLWIDRDLEFAPSGRGNLVILPENALVNDKTLMWTIYGQANLRPLRNLGIRTELSYRIAEDTGYVTDLDGYLKGKLRASYVVQARRPVTLGFYVRGGIGENSDFSMVDGLGPNPSGPKTDRDFERSHWSTGLTVDTMLRDDVTVFASLFYSQARQDDDLVLSDVQRYFQESVPLTFQSQGSLESRTDEAGIVVGSQVSFTEKTDGGFSYSFTNARSTYDDAGSSRSLRLIKANQEVDANIHAMDFELRHQVREGLRVFGGYRFQHFRDGASKPDSPSSSTQPPDRSQWVHTVSFGITLNGDLLK